jgi:Leucine-rich repeat (LRR) protein
MSIHFELHMYLHPQIDIGQIVCSFIPEDAFSDLRNLMTLQLSANRIDNIWSTTFNGLRALSRLHLADNRLSDVPIGVLRHCPRLRQLYLDGNLLPTLRRCSVPRRARLRTVSLVGNPVRCDCRLAWMADLHRRGNTTVWGTCRKPAPGRSDGVDGESGGLASIVAEQTSTCTGAAAASDCML